MATQFRVIAGEGCIYKDDFYIASTSSSGFKRVAAVVGGLDEYFERGFQLWKFIQSINFTQTEISFYLAFLFFNGKISAYFFVFRSSNWSDLFSSPWQFGKFRIDEPRGDKIDGGNDGGIGKSLFELYDL